MDVRVSHDDEQGFGLNDCHVEALVVGQQSQDALQVVALHWLIRPHRGQDDDQELPSQELLHRAQLDVRQAHPVEQHTDLLWLFPVGSDNANVSGSYRIVELLGQLAAVQHHLYRLSRVEPRRVVSLPHLCAQREGKLTGIIGVQRLGSVPTR